MLSKSYLIAFLFCLAGNITLPNSAYSQYILNGNATKESCNCYILTQPLEFQGGSVWQQSKINLTESFDFTFNVFLGYNDNGADGIAFMLQPLSTSLGASGGGMGFDGVKPSLGVLLDTYQNSEDNDPPYDHISIQVNGEIKHGNDLAGPIPASATSDNIEDGLWHTLRISWNANTHTINTYFDGEFRLTATKDLVKEIFNNSPMVYWGFTAATGGMYNLQKFCTALNPSVNTSPTNGAVCLGTPISFIDNSTSFTTIKNYSWDFGDGTTSTNASPSPHNYVNPGEYNLKLTITGSDGCVSEPFIQKLTIGDFPILKMNIQDTCEKINPLMEVETNLKVGNVNQWKWELDGMPFSNLQKPDLTNVAPGNHSMKLTATSNIGCVSNSITDNFIINNAPQISIKSDGGCNNVPVLFTGIQNDALTSINNWNWDFGDQSFGVGKEVSHLFAESKSYLINLQALSTKGCSAIVQKNITINSVHADAGRDTLIVENVPLQLKGSGGLNYSWQPITGLNNPNIANPIAILSDDIRYRLTVTTADGCVDEASVNVSVFKGSAIYVPTAFTPNNDGLNDILKPYYIGIKSLYYFTIFDRWGKKVFYTTDMKKGWNGNWQGQLYNSGTFSWVLKAVDQVGKIFDLKGIFVLIK
jgi:gliding motility-associated-like protein